jgi:hypothetical protein
MDNKVKPKQIEIGIMFLFIIMTTFMIVNGEIFLDHFKEKDSISKLEFKRILLKSFFQSIVINGGLIVIYYINKNRIKNGKKPI